MTMHRRTYGGHYDPQRMQESPWEMHPADVGAEPPAHPAMAAAHPAMAAAHLAPGVPHPGAVTFARPALPGARPMPAGVRPALSPSGRPFVPPPIQEGRPWENLSFEDRRRWGEWAWDRVPWEERRQWENLPWEMRIERLRSRFWGRPWWIRQEVAIVDDYVPAPPVVIDDPGYATLEALPSTAEEDAGISGDICTGCRPMRM